ncbi:MAG: aspartate/glutamate racemase family protein [Desulfobacteraceae bacterium]|jgi:glutamate racemase
MHNLPDKERITLLVTDSGLGGLSICADMVGRLIHQHANSALSVVYFNAWPLKEKGYNYLDSDVDRIRVFGNAMSAMNQYDPDMIFIACNTLSVIFHQGNLAGKVRAPVVDIINHGVEMIADKLDNDPGSTALILGTKTTISSNAHKKRLAQRGILENRIVQQHCHGLAGAIERDPDSPEVEWLINQFMADAAALLATGTKQIYAALCCTHYGYCQALIRKSLTRHSGARVDIINPNQAMSDHVNLTPKKGSLPEVNLEINVVSRVPLSKEKIDAISKRIERVSPQTAQALRDYKLIPDLFTI